MNKYIYIYIGVNQIYNIDSKILIKNMINKNFKVDAIITDPPYNISRKNNFKSINRFGIDFGNWDNSFDQLGWLENINKILKSGGSILIFNDWKNLGIISNKLQSLGFNIKDIIRWIKPNPMPRNTSRRYVTDYEFALWATYSDGKWTFNKSSKIPYLKPEFNIPIVASKKRLHPTEKPINLIKKLIDIHTNEGDIIFDPFSGSGSISQAAKELNRYYIGCEIDKEYYEKSITRLNSSHIKPIFNHLGNKYRMIDELINLFPKKGINCFVEAFAGTGIVSLNYQVPENFILNDNDKYISKILKYLIDNDVNLIIKKIESIIKKFKLPINCKLFNYKNEYILLRDDFNKNKSIDKLLVLILYGFNQQIRFNSKNEWNIPPGKFVWNSYQRNKVIDYCNSLKIKKYSIYSKDFVDFIDDIIDKIDKEKTLFYFDPPYFISNATYNIQWNIDDEKRLLVLLTKLTNNGFKWCLSNLLNSKNKSNFLLKEFIKNNNKIKCLKIKNVTYKNSNYQRKNLSSDNEILVFGNL